MLIHSRNNSFDITELLNNLNNLRSYGFIVIKGYESQNGSIADFYIQGKVNYLKIVEQSLVILKSLNFQTIPKEFDPEIVSDKLVSLKSWMEKTINKKSTNTKNCYIEIVPGLEIHKPTNHIHVYGLLVPGPDGSQYTSIKEPETEKTETEGSKVRKYLLNLTPLGKFRRFILDNNFQSISLLKSNFESAQAQVKGK